MNEIQWDRLMNTNDLQVSGIEVSNIVNQLKHQVTFIKFKSNCHTYSRIYYLALSEDVIHYKGSRDKSKNEACKIKDIDQVRAGFTTAVWKACLNKRKITRDIENLAFSILYDNNRHSLDLLAETEEIRSQWIEGLTIIIQRYQSHVSTHHEITNQWIWQVFSQADSDQSGYLNRREVHRLLVSLNIELDERSIDTYFNRANIRTNTYEQLKHLDKDEFLTFYKIVSCRPELIELVCQFNGSTPQKKKKVLSDYNILNNIARLSPVAHPQDASEISFAKSVNKRQSSFISCRRGSSSVKTENPSRLCDVTDENQYLSIEQLQDFLQKEQHLKTISIEDCSKLIARFEPSLEGRASEELSVDGLRLLLLHDEFCIMNPNKTRRVYHDMTRPITDYFIATSHNTYIRDTQIYGECTPETYIHALRTGCRAVEMDCYDGDNMEPIVYHGNTLTTPITFREIIMAIKPEAFSVSPYPIFLNIENHCTYQQQGIMARLLKEVFRDQLLSEPLVENFDKLPSPEDLKYKVLIRSRRYPKGKTAADPKSDRSNDETEANPKDYHPDFSNLIIYSEIVSFKDITHSLCTQKCFHSISFKESKADDLIDARAPDNLDLIRLTQHHLVRVYPGTKRQNSSNINPVDYWNYGVQMVALNYQSNDNAMRQQHGFFSDNGGCGYLLKSPCLLSDDPLFDPKAKNYKKGKHLQIRIISGQHLPKEHGYIKDKDVVDPFVEVITYGIRHDSTEHRTRTVHNNGLNPIWDHKIDLDIYCPELCLVLFKVRDEDRYGASKFLGQACIPFTALQLGYRHIKLKEKNGDYICGTLFVHVKIEDF
ncbi:unnamed protein product [Rotaria magnacalcarata]|uniref:Phosphoinositide phospholipase C n=5 Tax=Rotaria magnacalcarata TaxID=392030 RepID=A0A815YXZ1_9BILA|nr:unnamed protein product [Rotaria magnacalcarata]CAF4091763.1 unnamed protein product [Rotaria magnacalcarata]